MGEGGSKHLVKCNKPKFLWPVENNVGGKAWLKRHLLNFPQIHIG